MIENERKFILGSLPQDFDEYVKSEIQQWYLYTGDPHIRIRKYDSGDCYIDIKWAGGISRKKIGFKCQFDNVEKLIIGSPNIKKVRYKKHHLDYLLIIDIFESGLKLIEVESKDIEKLLNLDIPNWFGEEVTGDIRYSNCWLAQK